MTKPIPGLIIFDLDGTLIDSVGDIALAVNQVLTRHGRQALDVADVRRMVGEGAAMTVERALAARPGPALAFETALADFLEAYELGPITHTQLYPGTSETLESLAAAGWRLAVSTNKPEAPARHILEAFGLTRHMATVFGGDTHPYRKPDPRMLTGIMDPLGFSADRTIMVGDSETDAATAKAAGVPFVLMTYGYRKGPAEAIEALARLDRMGDLPATLSSQP